MFAAIILMFSYSTAIIMSLAMEYIFGFSSLTTGVICMVGVFLGLILAAFFFEEDSRCNCPDCQPILWAFIYNMVWSIFVVMIGAAIYFGAWVIPNL